MKLGIKNMSLINKIFLPFSKVPEKGKLPFISRQRTFWSSIPLFMLLLTSCASNTPETGVSYSAGSFKGVVISDSTQATLVGREVLKAGGNAFDAATSMAFTMAVVLPSRAGLGSYGVCQVFNPKQKERQTLTFNYNSENKNYAIPIMPRAMMALHAKGGEWNWNAVLIPAEKIAKTGFIVSKTLAEDGKVKYDGKYLDENGKELKENDTLVSLDLASSLALIRSKGIAGLYTGDGAKRFLDASRYSSVDFKKDELANLVPVWQDSDKVSFGNDTVYFNPSAVSSASPMLIWQKETDEFSEQKITTENEIYGAGLAVSDALGNAVTCTFSMGDLFGTGKEIEGTGILLAKPFNLPTDKLATMMIVNDNVNEFKYAGYAIAENASEKMIKSAKKTLASKDIPETVKDGNVSGGAVFCLKGLPSNPVSCSFVLEETKDSYGLKVGN